MSAQIITKEHVGKRLLLTDGYTGRERTEVTVLELSPSLENVKVRYENSGSTAWRKNDIWDCHVLEVLP